MELNGKLFKVFPVQSGVSKSSGKPYAIQQAVLEIPDDKYPKKMVFEIFGEERIQQADMHEGEEVNVSFDIDAREYKGKFYNSIRAFSVVKLTQPQAQPQPQRHIPTQPVPQTPQMFPDEVQNDNADDLPF